MKRALSILATLAAICSCTLVEVDEELEQGDVVHAFKASVTGNEAEYEDAVPTKGSIASNDMTFTWTEGDYVGVWAEESDLFEGGSTRVIFKSKTGGTSTTTFEGNGWGLLRGNSYFAHYPYEQSQTSTEVALSWTGQEQAADADASHLASHAYYHTYYSVPTTGVVSLNFNPIGANVKFKATLPPDMADAYFTELTVTSDEEIFTSSAVYNPSSSSVSLVPSRSSSLTLLLNGSEGIHPSEGMLTMLMAMAPTEYSGKTLTFVLTDANGGTYKATKVPKTNLNPGDRRTYSLTFVSDDTIAFEDSNVKSICVSLWDTDGDGELSYFEAAAVTEIPYDAFNGNKTIVSFNEFQYFVNCTTLRSLREATSDDTDFNGAFEGCSALTSIVLPPSLTTIGYSSFKECTSLQSITIPASVTQIRDLAFVGDPQLEVHMESASPVVLTKHTGSNPYYYAFGYTGQKVKVIYVPTEAAETAYKASPYYEFYKLIIHAEGYMPSASHEYVDLGLPSGVKWATMNIGASAPEESGDYFAWGATEPWYEAGYAQEFTQSHWKAGYTGYNMINAPYQINSNSPSLTETIWSKYLGSIDSKYRAEGTSDSDALRIILESIDDAATSDWGSNWRMPTRYEWAELMNTDYCSWVWTTINGIKGYKINSKITGYTDKWIFLPSAGYRDYSFLSTGSGYYWSSSLRNSNPNYAYGVRFSSSSIGYAETTRNQGCSIRPVLFDDPNRGVTGVTLGDGTSSVTLSLSGSYSWDAHVSLATGDVIDNYLVEWYSSDPSVATVEKNNGKVRPVSEGTATITVKTVYGSYTASRLVTVKDFGTHEYVDLGLSVKWATMNVGASAPEEYGDYFAWGSTEPWYESGYAQENPQAHWKPGYEDGYTLVNAPYMDNPNYETDRVIKWSGYTSTPATLRYEDDVANYLWNNGWHLPTYGNWAELINDCNWTWTTINGVKGYKITSKKTGYTDKWIFLPAAGFRENDTLFYLSYVGYYWSSTLGNSPNEAKVFRMEEKGSGKTTCIDCPRSCGSSIRPVKY